MKQACRASHLVCLLLCVMSVSGCGGSADVQPEPTGTPPGPTTNGGGFNQAEGANGSVRSVVPAGDGSGDIYVLGDFTTYGGRPVGPLVRVQPDGSVKDTFTLPGSIRNRISSIGQADDGSGDLYVADSIVDPVSFPPTGLGHVWRLNPDGTIDTAFAMGTVTSTSDAFPSDPDLQAMVRGMVPVGDGSGRVYAAVSGLYNGTEVGPVVRLDTNGAVDSTFTQNRQVPSVFRIVRAEDGSGDLYVATYRRDDPNTWLSYILLRLNADGTLDQGFETGNSSYPEARIGLVTPVQDGTGDVFATGVFLNVAEPNPGGPFSLRGLVRFDPTGAVDYGSPRPQVTSPAILALVRARDGSGDWFVGETSTSGQIRLDRYNPDGTLDPDFTPGLITGNALNVVVPAPDNSGGLYVGGEFSSYNGVGVNHLVRVNADGTLDAGTSP